MRIVYIFMVGRLTCYCIYLTDISRDSLTDCLILYFHAGYVCCLQHFDKDNTRVSEVDGCLPASSYISNRNLMYELAGDFT